jgi:hypothetical protein
MKKHIRILVVCGALLIFVSCREDKKDTITRHRIHGMVFNNCTDSGLAGVKVFLQTFKDDKTLVLQRETISQEGGKFEFLEAEIHSSNQYNYALHIESKSGTAAQTPEHCGFDGTTMYFDNNEVNLEFKPRVTPRFLFLCYATDIVFPVKQPDSIHIFFQQRTFHQNVPTLPYSGKITNNTVLGGCTGNYPMGWWHFDVQRWRNGSYTRNYDSLYLGWADTKTYSVTW